MLDNNIYTYNGLNLFEAIEKVYNSKFLNADHCDKRNFDPNKAKIKDILWDNILWFGENVKNGTFSRPAIVSNVTKTLLCNTHYLGYDYFACPNCNNFNMIYHKCHSRFCNSCGVKSQRLLGEKVSSMAVDAPHRHIVFTIPEELRPFFAKDRYTLNFLFIAARNTLDAIFNNNIYKKKVRKDFKRQKYLYENYSKAVRFGLISCLHTFGRDLKWNPHIHCLVPEIVYNPVKDIIKKFHHLDFKKLRKTFQFEILRLMHEYFGDSFKKFKNDSYSNHKDGFYVYAKYDNYSLSDTDNININQIKTVEAKVMYIMRYASRPAMAESRITKYDSKNNMVYWYYDRHEDNQRVDVCESATEFLKKLLIHIPDEDFLMVRYYGFYNNRCTKLRNRIYSIIAKEKQSVLKTVEDRRKLAILRSMKYKSRTFILDSYNRDILKCPCGSIMMYIESYVPEEIVNEQYREQCINEVYKMRLRRRSS